MAHPQLGSNSNGSGIWEVPQEIQGTNLPDRCGGFAHCIRREILSGRARFDRSAQVTCAG
jgi:hypothetical protein